MEDYQTPQKMKRVGLDMSRFTQATTKAGSERASLLEPFIERLQGDAKRTGYKPMSKARICMLMAYIDTEDLYMFHKKLTESPCYGGIWMWYVNPKDLNKK